jgi:site-specific DNA recombinase
LGRISLKNAVIYLRVSTDRQAEKDLSLPTQLSACQRFARENALTVVKVFEDAGESARTSDRPAFLEMIDFSLTHAKTLGLKTVICWDTSRFARNRYDALLYKKQLEKQGIRVLFASQSIGEGPEGELLEGFLELVDEFYSKALSRNIIRGMEENTRRGFFNGSRTPFGYQITKAPDGKGNMKGKLEICDHDAEIVRTIFKLYLEGYGYRALAEELTRRGLHNRNGNPFCTKSVETILGNVAYRGTLRFRGIFIENAHPPIISKETFVAVQAARQARNPERLPGRQQSSPMLFSGLLYCGECGQKLTFERAFKPKKAYTYYSCSSFKTKRVPCSVRLRLDAEKLDRFLLDRITERILNDSNIKHILLGLMKLRAELLNQSRSKTMKIRSEIAGLQKKTDNLVEAVADGTLPKDLVQGRLEKLREDKERLELELAHGEVIAFPKINVSAQFIERFRSICKEIFLSGDIKKRQTFLKNFIKKIDLTRDTCKVHYDLARLLVAHGDSSRLREELVELNGIEPSAS